MEPLTTLDCPPVDALLQYARGDVEPQTRKAIEAHLIACGVCCLAVAEAAAELRSDDPTGHAAPPNTRSLCRGASLGRYVILDPLGRGGMGEVYSAFDPILDRTIALKLLHTGMTDDAGRQLMIREARAMARLSHRNVVTVHEVGEADGEIFIAMELVPGTTLSRWLRVGQRSWSQVRDALVGAARGLAAAHAKGLVHRDFKLANVIIGSDGESRVLDFGLAQPDTCALGGGPGPHPRAAAPPSVIEPPTIGGTLAFMAPEQLQGAFDARSDQFAFGVSLYKGLAGTLPFPAQPASRRVEAIRSGPPELRGRVPTWLRAAVAKMVAFDPEDRFASMEQVVEALQRDRRRRRFKVGALVLTAALSASAASIATYLIPPELSPQEVALVNGLTESARQAAHDGLFVFPPPDAPTRQTAARSIAALEALDEPAAAVARQHAAALRGEFAQLLEARADALWGVPQTRAFARDLYAAAVTFDPHRSRARDRSGFTVGELAELRGDAATGNFTSVELQAAAPLAALIRGADTPGGDLGALVRDSSAVKASKLRALAELPGPAPQSEPPSAAPVPRTEKRRPSASPPPESKASSAVEQGWAAHKRLRWGEAIQHFTRALGAAPGDARALHGLAASLFEQGHYHRGIRYAKQAVARRPKDGRLRVLLGDLYYRTHEYDKARQAYNKAKALGDARGEQGLARLTRALGEGSGR